MTPRVHLTPRIIEPLYGKRGTALFGLILLVTGTFSVLQAVARPFWFDEVCTVIVSRLPGLSDIWDALNNAADTNPPLFYYVCRLTRAFVPDDHIAYRLPSIAGFIIALSCVYAILSRRVGKLAALTGTAFLLYTPLTGYASEARPYALMIGCITAAILAWQRIDDSRTYWVLLVLTLAAAISLHYTAIFVWPAFVVAEAAIWMWHRRFRIRVWIAFAAGAAPLLLFRGLLAHLQQYYGQHFWSPVRLLQPLEAYDWLFNVKSYLGVALVIAVSVIFLYWLRSALKRRFAMEETGGTKLRVEEGALACMLLWLPVIAVISAEISHGGMTERYMLPATVGGALTIGYLVERGAPQVRLFMLCTMLLSYGLTSIHQARTIFTDSLLSEREGASRAINELGLGHYDPALPIVISSGFQYLSLAYYNPPEQYRNVYALIDRQAAIAFGKTDSVDRALLVLRRYFPLQVKDYREFSLQHREFLLLSASMFDWWPSRLAHDGHLLKLLSNDGETRIYRVTLQH